MTSRLPENRVLPDVTVIRKPAELRKILMKSVRMQKVPDMTIPNLSAL